MDERDDVFVAYHARSESASPGQSEFNVIYYNTRSDRHPARCA